jgi:hypothetical protein
MNLNYKHLGMYLVAGVASGLLCRLIFTNDEWSIFGPSLVLGAMITLAGRYISGITPRNTWLNPLILILACGIGWFLAFQHGVNDGFYIWPVESGVIGGFFVGIGLVIAWRLKRIWMIIVLTTLAGGLGGLVLALPELVAFKAIFPLFITWQAILLLCIGIAIQIDSRNSSIEE